MSDFYSARSIIVGAAAIFLSKIDSLNQNWPLEGVALPSAPASGTSYQTALQASAEWRNVGYTQDGIEFNYTPDYGEVEVDQLLDSAKLFKQKMTATVKTNLVETTLENLLVAWAQSAYDYEGLPGSGSYKQKGVEGTGDANGFNSGGASSVPLSDGDEHLGIAAGALGIEPIERSMAFVGGSPRVFQTATATAARGKKRERVYHLRRVISVEASQHNLKRNEATMFPVTFRLLPASVSGAEYGSIRDRVITTS